MPRLRILPLTIFAAALLLSIKIGALSQEDVFSVGRESVAKSTPKPEAREAPEVRDAAAAKTKSKSKSKEVAAKPPARSTAPARSMEKDPTLFSEAEIELLQNLAKRRTAIQAWARELDTREALLDAAEKRLDSKIAELKSLRSRVQTLVRKVDAREEARLKSLVKIYENMKPKDAARIFDELELPILLDVVARMREVKTAPILAKMDSQKAKHVTAELAEREEIPGQLEPPIARKGSN